MLTYPHVRINYAKFPNGNYFPVVYFGNRALQFGQIINNDEIVPKTVREAIQLIKERFEVIEVKNYSEYDRYFNILKHK